MVPLFEIVLGTVRVYPAILRVLALVRVPPLSSVRLPPSVRVSEPE